ncbi:cation diffusion facilitator family transporter [Caldanaerobius fijiensis DSM 17918]|uniref:Cation diffusion facilitator family transporter n=1 Tax=Caldanaerobius fijiensis DSM 17918 TaxID=1121256 RepID=A0A1M4Y901_9THEO|nr:cation diffusion facilitator family transporter [Caldanaerobius fijiensis]SHF02130.1 cation diffusion facilitator family transporter [Caldanaerobius fijiensis DSM 17918]
MDNFKKIRNVLVSILFLNILVALAKLFYGLYIKSSSMVADGYHSLSDSSGNIIGLIGIYIASKPEDTDHPYGHKKFETYASIFISVMLFLVSYEILKNALTRFVHPVRPQIDIDSFVIMLVTLAINIFVFKYEYSAGKKLNSDILVSDSLHTSSDIYVSISVILTLLGVRLGLPVYIDPLISTIISMLIIKAAIGVIKHSSAVLCDKTVLNEEEIKDIIKDFNEVKSCHKIRSRGREDDIYVDLHVIIDPDMHVEDAHRLEHSITERIKEKIKGVKEVDVHIEPATRK